MFKILRLIGNIYLSLQRIWRGILILTLKHQFRKCGEKTSFDPFGFYTFKTISIGRYVYIGPKAHFSASNSFIDISNKVMFGPNVTIITGDHNVSNIGMYMFDNKDKLPEDDQPVCICQDVWVGANVTILKGVTIGRGAIIAAGALVIKDIPPYSIAGGVPARVLKFRWGINQIMEHERNLYGPEERMGHDELEIVGAPETV